MTELQINWALTPLSVFVGFVVIIPVIGLALAIWLRSRELRRRKR